MSQGMTVPSGSSQSPKPERASSYSMHSRQLSSQGYRLSFRFLKTGPSRAHQKDREGDSLPRVDPII